MMIGGNNNKSVDSSASSSSMDGNQCLSQWLFWMRFFFSVGLV